MKYFVLGFVSDDYTKSMPDILAIGFQEICDLTATNMVWQRYCKRGSFRNKS
jgi:hypothetical protein